MQLSRTVVSYKIVEHETTIQYVYGDYNIFQEVGMFGRESDDDKKSDQKHVYVTSGYLAQV